MNADRGISRRELFEIGAVAGATAFLPAALAQDNGQATKRSARRPKNIIFMVSDGMSTGVPSMAEPFSQQVRGRGTNWYRLMKDRKAANGHFETCSLSSMVTDSAAASTAWASGSRVFNGSLNVLPDGRRLTPIGQLVRNSGRRVGLVTTTTMTHATPAGFATIQARRDDQHQIAPQYMDVVDVLMGGGREHFDPALRSDGRDVIGEFEGKGYAFCDNREALKRSSGLPKILGLFWQGHVPYTIDHRNQQSIRSKVPTLEEMTRVALESLSRNNPNGFLLQVEGGRVDHAAHANDAAALLWDQIAFDDAIEVALDFAKSAGDTLVVITSDHGNANPGLNGMGSGYRNTNECFERIALATASYEHLAGRFKGELSTDEVQRIAQGAFGLALSHDEAEIIRGAAGGDLPGELNRQHRNMVGVLGQVLGNHTGVGWTGVSHTEDLVLLSAVGPSAGAFSGLLRNSEAFERLTDMMGIRHRNPSMSAEEAQPLLAAMSEEELVHWA